MAIYLGTNMIDVVGLQPGNQLGYMGKSNLIAEKTFSFPLSDTNYSSLTISTSNQTLTLPTTDYTTTASTTITALRLGENYDGTPISKTLHDYVCIGEGNIIYKYTVDDSTINTLIHGVKSGISKDYQQGRYHTISSSGEINEASWSSSGSYVTGTSILLYRKTDGTYSSTSSVGIYTSSSPSITVGTASGKDYMNLTLSSIYVRANNSYFPVEAMNYIDPTKTILTFTWHIYEGDMNVFGRIYQTAYANAAL